MDKFLDFNNANNQKEINREKIDVEQIRSNLLNRIEDVLFYLFPSGRIQNKQFYIGNIKGEQGKSLVIQLTGDKQGNWFDFATSQGGDIFTLWQEVMGYQKSDFPKLLNEINEWLGNTPAISKTQITKKSPPLDNLGKPTAEWNYFDKNNKLLAVVSRYDTDKGKEFRVWDIKSRKSKAPEIRPLYNIPHIKDSNKIILVEGEKSADALIEFGFAATTAMFGANAPLDKTDWSPLKDKEVIIWPDNDEAGISYAKKLSDHLQGTALFISTLTPPEGKEEKWDAYDAIKEKFDVRSFLNKAKNNSLNLPIYLITELLNDNSPMPRDIISPRLLTPGGMLVIGGAPKVGKSDFLINFLMHMAAGEKFLGFKPPKPLKVFYLQAEIGYHYMRERVQKLKISKNIATRAAKNLSITSNVHMILNDGGIEAVKRAIKISFGEEKPDIICIDPIRNLFDGGSENSSENDNSDMLFFLQNRVEKLRSIINPDMGIILCHHTRKIKKKDLEEDPFQAFSGAGSLRSFYSSGLILHRPDELESRIHLYFELRNGSSIPRKIVEKEDGKWVELNPMSERLVRQSYGEKLDAERDRRGDIIIDLIRSEALTGNFYTNNQFAEKFENKHGLGHIDSIRRRISVLSTKGFIKYKKSYSELGLKQIKSRYGILCVKDMKYKGNDRTKDILPTHYKSPNFGTILEVEGINIWPEHEGGKDE